MLVKTSGEKKEKLSQLDFFLLHPKVYVEVTDNDQECPPKDNLQRR